LNDDSKNEEEPTEGILKMESVNGINLHCKALREIIIEYETLRKGLLMFSNPKAEDEKAILKLFLKQAKATLESADKIAARSRSLIDRVEANE